VPLHIDFHRDWSRQGASHPYHFKELPPFAPLGRTFRLAKMKNGIDYRGFHGIALAEELAKIQGRIRTQWRTKDTVSIRWVKSQLETSEFATGAHHVELYAFVAATFGLTAFDPPSRLSIEAVQNASGASISDHVRHTRGVAINSEQSLDESGSGGQGAMEL